MIAQYSPQRLVKRALNRTSLDTTILPFDPGRFHFGKVRLEEVLLCFQAPSGAPCRGSAAAHCQSADPDGETCGLNVAGGVVLIVNVNPVCKGHSLLVPDVAAGQPQVLTEDALLLGLGFAAQASRRMWLSFNSIGAGASVNHLHWQAFFPGDDPREVFPVVQILRRDAGGEVLLETPTANGGVVVVSLRPTPDAWPARGWCFTLEDGVAFDIAISALADRVFSFVQRLQALDVAHNLLVGEGGTQILVFPRKTLNQQGTDVSQLQVASHEMLGWWIIPRREDFESFEEAAAAEFLGTAALSEEMELNVYQELWDLGWVSQLPPPPQMPDEL